MTKNNGEMTLEQFMATMNKKFGDRALVEFDDGVAAVEAVSTGLLSLDYALGVGGAPRGRIIEIYGPESAGKTTVAITICAECQQRAGQLPIMAINANDEAKPLTGRIGFLDVEHAFNPEFAKTLGLDLSKGSGFMFDQPDSGVEALQKLEYMIDSNLFDVIVVDSVAGLTTLDEENKDIGAQVMAGTAQLMSSSLKKLKGKINKSRTLVIFINQIREKPATMFGSPETTPGGRALKFYSSVRMRVSKAEQIMEGSNQIGHRMKISIKKNKVAPPYKDAVIDLVYRDTDKRKAGFDKDADILDMAQKYGVVMLKGSSYSYVDTETGEVHKAAGKVKWFEYLDNNPKIKEDIKAETLRMAAGGIDND